MAIPSGCNPPGYACDGSTPSLRTNEESKTGRCRSQFAKLLGPSGLWIETTAFCQHGEKKMEFIIVLAAGFAAGYFVASKGYTFSSVWALVKEKFSKSE